MSNKKRDPLNSRLFAINNEALEEALLGMRKRRAWCRGHLHFNIQKMRTSFRRAAWMVLPTMEWIASSKQGWSLERTPWPEDEPIAPELDAQGYKDRLIRGMQWRIAHYKRVVRSNGAVNQPIWIQDWSTRKPPTKMYLRRCCLQDPDAERKNVDGLIETYYQEFNQIEALYQYHTQIGEQMRALVNFCKGTGKSSSVIESIVGIEVPKI